MTTGLVELNESATAWAWQALQSPKPGEIIFRRGVMLAYCQFDREGKLREATLRRIISDGLTSELMHVGWNDTRKIPRVVDWFASYGETAAERAQLRERSKAAQ